MASRKILVCGGAGFIGSHLVERFMAEGHEVDVVDDLSTGSLANLADSRNASGRFKFQNISVQSSEFAELVALKRPDIIVNLAVFTPSHAHSAGALASLGATVSVLEAARLGGVSKVVHRARGISANGGRWNSRSHGYQRLLDRHWTPRYLLAGQSRPHRWVAKHHLVVGGASLHH